MYWTRLRHQTSKSDIGIRYQHRTSTHVEAGRLGGLVAIVGHMSGPPEMHVLDVYKKGLISDY